jgi:hypothetical protein
MRKSDCGPATRGWPATVHRTALYKARSRTYARTQKPELAGPESRTLLCCEGDAKLTVDKQVGNTDIPQKKPWNPAQVHTPQGLPKLGPRTKRVDG